LTVLGFEHRISVGTRKKAAAIKPAPATAGGYQMKSRDEIREALTCPIASVKTLFSRDGSIDLNGMRSFIDFTISGGTKTILLTYGDSLYTLLSDQEIAEVTRAVVQHTAGRALVVAADGIWATPQEIAFAEFVREIGADVLMVLPPDWAASCTVDTFVEHYAAIAEHLPIMVVTNVFARRQALGLDVLKILRDQVPGIIAIKDDVGGEFVRKMCLLVHDRWAVFAGGQKQNHLDMIPYGCDGYMSTFIQFKPSIAQEYWTATQTADWGRAKHVISTYDMPYFDFVMQLPGGFDAGIHGALELFGIAQRWRRKPYYSLNDQQMEQLAGFFRDKSLL
jgi:dihydrodipicolinate synthase/N-acetylneuraminate lyase